MPTPSITRPLPWRSIPSPSRNGITSRRSRLPESARTFEHDRRTSDNTFRVSSIPPKLVKSPDRITRSQSPITSPIRSRLRVAMCTSPKETIFMRLLESKFSRTTDFRKRIRELRRLGRFLHGCQPHWDQERLHRPHTFFRLLDLQEVGGARYGLVGKAVLQRERTSD